MQTGFSPDIAGAREKCKIFVERFRDLPLFWMPAPAQVRGSSFTGVIVKKNQGK